MQYLLPLVAVALLLAFVAWKLRSRRMPAGGRRRVEAAWATVVAQGDSVRRILEADKVLDLALKELGYGGSLGDKLKRAGPRIHSLDAVWRAHKLRNRLAHETHAAVTPAEADAAVRAIEIAVRRFL